MAAKKIELDVDIIGNQKDGLTKKEEKSLKDYFKKLKSASQKKRPGTKSRALKKTKTTA